MATRQFKAHQEKGNHEVGNLSSLKVKTVAHGAICGEDIDNFTIVELSHNAEGERVAVQLTDATKKGYLIASPETRYMGEDFVDYYNGEGERARIVILEPHYTRFDSSAFDAAGVSEIKNGQVAYFDPSSKKFVILPAGTADATYTGAADKFLVVSNEEDIEYTLGKATVRFEVQ
ncbi:hypothetical protein [Halobacillus litoralis]|uniref:hypothetical protein n=1 Tax=Halobacillus litoralis TaxID=45668 RepID=UPI001CD79F2B|nr:hypothetical protein [Halobacillus litoralis]MCA1021639.1 hypothetical protein [Halobacillus litoralis]